MEVNALNVSSISSELSKAKNKSSTYRKILKLAVVFLNTSSEYWLLEDAFKKTTASFKIFRYVDDLFLAFDNSEDIEDTMNLAISKFSS